MLWFVTAVVTSESRARAASTRASATVPLFTAPPSIEFVLPMVELLTVTPVTVPPDMVPLLIVVPDRERPAMEQFVRTVPEAVPLVIFGVLMVAPSILACGVYVAICAVSVAFVPCDHEYRVLKVPMSHVAVS